jgi:hypothetical protein
MIAGIGANTLCAVSDRFRACAQRAHGAAANDAFGQGHSSISCLAGFGQSLDNRVDARWQQGAAFETFKVCQIAEHSPGQAPEILRRVAGARKPSQIFLANCHQPDASLGRQRRL